MSGGSNWLKSKVPNPFWVWNPAGLGVWYLRSKILKNYEKIKIEKNNSKCHSIIIISHLQINLSAPVEMAPISGPLSEWMARFSCQPSKHILPILPMKPCMDFSFSFARWTIAKFPIFWGVCEVATMFLSALNWDLKIWKILKKNFSLKFLKICAQNAMGHHKKYAQYFFFIFDHRHTKYYQMTWSVRS